MKIACVATEISPVIKIGGLADVTFGLNRELQNSGHETFIIVPKYASMKKKYLKNFKALDLQFKTIFNKKEYTVKVWSGDILGLKIYFLESISPKSFFQSKQIYGQRNDGERFSFFSLAALEFIKKFHSSTNIIHINEWQTALIAPLYHERFKKDLTAKVLLTIHNLNYQGILGPTLLEKVGLNKKSTQKSCLDLNNKNKINLLKGAIIYSDFITTVSPKYAKEITDSKLGAGLHSIILKNKDKVKGILNGIDYDVWNPNTDPALNTHYQVTSLDKKRACKLSLQKRLKLPQKNEEPLVICICRLVPQKGLSMIKAGIIETLKLGGQFVLFGSSPISKIQQDFEILKRSLNKDTRAKLIFNSYNEELAHQIYAGADMIICPSLYEPCGLTQLISLRYGTVPIVRKTGGLANTVFDFSTKSANGFCYTTPAPSELCKTLHRAFETYKHPKIWKKLIQSGMKMDFSWKRSAKEYLNLYKRLVSKK